MSALRTAMCAALAATPLLAPGGAHADGWRAWSENGACYVRVTAQGAPAAFGFFRSRSAAVIFYSEPPERWTASDRVTLQVDHDAPIPAFAARQTASVVS